MSVIPPQLQHESFRFCKIRKIGETISIDKDGKKRLAKGKEPFPTDWQTTNNFVFHDQHLIDYITDGSYGVIGGFGNLVIIDFDNEDVQNTVEPKLPDTFTVKSGGKGLHHCYYVVTDAPENIKVLDINENTLADIQGKGKQVVGPGSTHESGRRYEVIKDIPIASTTMSAIRDVFSPWLVRELEKKEPADFNTDPINDEIRRRQKLSDLLRQYGIDNVPNASNGLCMCPLGHDSISRQCFHYDDDKGLWHCFHCGKGGDVFTLVALKNNLDPKGDFCVVKSELCNKLGIENTPPKEKSSIRNYEVEFEKEDDKQKTKKYAINVLDIHDELVIVTEAWPRCVGRELFVLDKYKNVRFIMNEQMFFAYLHGVGIVKWATGIDNVGNSFITKSEFLEYLRNNAITYSSVETVPHEPRIPDMFYVNDVHAEGYEPNGMYLERLLDFFGNFKTPLDRDLARAMFCTPAWGGPPGMRPAFYLDAIDRGCGKTTMTSFVAEIYGGMHDIQPEMTQIDRIAGGLLDAEALTKRCVRIDNAKNIETGRFSNNILSSPIVENLITCQNIIAHKLFVGQTKRPNYLTWFITANGLQLTRDTAMRCFIINLIRPLDTNKKGWEINIIEFIKENRQKILADVFWILKKNGYQHTLFDRWQAWIDNVLAKCTEKVDAIIEMNNTRRGESDEENEELRIVEHALYDAFDRPELYIKDLSSMNNSIFEDIEKRDTTTYQAFMHKINDVLNKAFGRKITHRETHTMMKKFIVSGRMKYASLKEVNRGTILKIEKSYFDSMRKSINIEDMNMKEIQQHILVQLDILQQKFKQGILFDDIMDQTKVTEDVLKPIIDSMISRGEISEISPNKYLKLR